MLYYNLETSSCNNTNTVSYNTSIQLSFKMIIVNLSNAFNEIYFYERVTLFRMHMYALQNDATSNDIDCNES